MVGLHWEPHAQLLAQHPPKNNPKQVTSIYFLPFIVCSVRRDGIFCRTAATQSVRATAVSLNSRVFSRRSRQSIRAAAAAAETSVARTRRVSVSFFPVPFVTRRADSAVKIDVVPLNLSPDVRLHSYTRH